MNYFLSEFDILDAIYEIRCPVLDYIMHFFTLLGEAGIFWILLTLVLIIVPKTRRIGLSTAAAFLVEFICVNLTIKPLVKRTRPCIANTSRAIDTIISLPSGYSFPSGHSAAGFVVSTVIAKHNLKYGIIALTASAISAFSRLYFYVHYPTDVLAGAMIGVLSGVIMDKVVMNSFKKHDEKIAAQKALAEGEQQQETEEATAEEDTTAPLPQDV